MKLSKTDFTGTGKVYCFTLMQQLKNKANLISAVILLAAVLFSVPVISLITGGIPSDFGAFPFSVVYINNETDIAADFSDLASENGGFAGVRFEMADGNTDPGVNGLRVDITASDDGVVISTFGQQEEYEWEVSLLCAAVQERLNTAVFQSMGLSAEQLDILSAGYSVQSYDTEEYFGEDNFETAFALQYGYSIFVMMLCVFSVAYIVRAIVDEKASKLVELLMVSVKPLALITGKILAVMTYIFGFFIAMFLCFGLSCTVSGLFLDASYVGDALAGTEIVSSLTNFNGFTVVAVLVSLLLAYMTFSIIAGLSGAGCSSMEDIESANLSSILLIMVGYMVSCFAAAFSGTGASVFFALCPFVSVFCAPVAYVCGDIGAGVLVLSWLIQAAIVVLLALFCARVYGALIMHKGSRVKLGQLLSMAKQEKRGRI